MVVWLTARGGDLVDRLVGSFFGWWADCLVDRMVRSLLAGLLTVWYDGSSGPLAVRLTDWLYGLLDWLYDGSVG